MELLRPDWDAPAAIAAVSTTRAGGVSAGPYASLNLGDHVGDDLAAVAENRRRLAEALDLPDEPVWLAQVHGTKVVEARPGAAPAEADAAISREPGVVCAVLTADCLPVLLASRGGDEVAAVHAGWRGLADGILDAALDAMSTPPAELLAWLGPAIAQPAFEVGGEVRERFIGRDPVNAAFFAPNDRDRWQADLAGLARRELEAAGATVSGGDFCTHDEAERFFSHRRDGKCGRHVTLIWLRS